MTNNQIVNFTSTSSGPDGWSSLSEFLECPAKAALKRRWAKENPNQFRSPFPESGKPVATLVGSIFGELAQLIQVGNPAPPRALFFWDGESLEKSHPLSCAEARRLADSYADNVMALGDVLACEMPIEIPEAIFGLRITGNIDLVCHKQGRLFIRDFKTEAREDNNLKLKFSLREQLWIYALGYELATGEKPDGVSIACCVKTQVPKFLPFEYEGLTDARFKWLQRSVDRVKAAMLDPRPTPSISCCFSYSSQCKHLNSDLMCGLL